MSTKSAIIIFLLAAGPMVALSVPFIPWIPDDAYIGFQYSRSFAEGDGLVFNPEERVEGFSNFLWTLGLALIPKMGGEIERTAPVASYAAAFLSLAVFVFFILRAQPVGSSAGSRGPTFLAGAIAVAFGSFFPLAFYATSGLETVPYLFCLLAGVACHLWGTRRESSSPHYLSLVAFLGAALMRPEGIGFLLLNSVFLLLRFRRQSGRLIAAVFVVLFAYLTALSVRFEYFGSVVPNTYYAKPPANLHYLTPILRGLEYLARMLSKSGVVFLLPFALVVPHDRRKRYTWFYLWALAGYQIFFIVVAGADVLRFDRFAVPLVPLILAIAATGTLGFVEGPDRRARRFTIRAVAAGVLVFSALNAVQAVNAHRKYCVHDWMHSGVHRDIGRMLGRLVPPGGEIVANEIGAIRYHSRRPVIDMLGLTDRTVAAIRFQSFRTYGVGSSPWSTLAVTRYLMDRNPACVVLPSEETLSLDDKKRHAKTMHPLWYRILTAPDIEDRYRPVGYVKIHDKKFLYFFLRNDIPLSPGVFEIPAGACREIRVFG
jgi:arabinofuranosyltransferase